ncbi:MAG: hypothetical protein JF621_02305 [Streptomyces turgidiscabies]|nr:hypothetical protein [Streptomyces turgidiscabies]
MASPAEVRVQREQLVQVRQHGQAGHRRAAGQVRIAGRDRTYTGQGGQDLGSVPAPRAQVVYARS